MHATWRYSVCRYLCEQQIDFRLSGRGLLARDFMQDDTFPEIQSRQRTCDLENGRSVNSTCAHVDIFLLREHASSLSVHSFGSYTFGTLKWHVRDSFVSKSILYVLKY